MNKKNKKHIDRGIDKIANGARDIAFSIVSSALSACKEKVKEKICKDTKE